MASWGAQVSKGPTTCCLEWAPHTPGPVPPSPAHQPLCPCRNILSLINEFSLPEQSISRDNYPAALLHLNATQPGRVARLSLRVCRLEDFLDQVPTGQAGWLADASLPVSREGACQRVWGQTDGREQAALVL